jgi:hypothetical protein
MQLIAFHACQYVSGQAVVCRSTMVQTGCGEVEWSLGQSATSNGIHYCSGSMSGNFTFTSSCTLNPPACNLLVSGIASSNQACSEHAYRGGKVALRGQHINCFPSLPAHGYTAEIREKAQTCEYKIARVRSAQDKSTHGNTHRRGAMARPRGAAVARTDGIHYPPFWGAGVLSTVILLKPV